MLPVAAEGRRGATDRVVAGRAVAGDGGRLVLVGVEDVVVGAGAEGDGLAVAAARVAGEGAHADGVVEGVGPVALVRHADAVELRRGEAGGRGLRARGRLVSKGS